MRSRWLPLAVCAAVMLGARLAAAQPHIVLVETAEAPPLPALAAQVQLHAGRPVTVTTLPHRADSAQAFAARASQIVTERDATIVVWIAALDGTNAAERTFLVYAAGRWPGRALIELVRIDARTAPGEVERTIALKIAGLLDTVTAPRPLGVALGIPVDAPRRAPWRIAVLGSLVRESGDRAWDGRLELVVERRAHLGRWSFVAGLGGHWQPSSAIEGTAGIVSIEDVGANLVIAGERWFGAFGLYAGARGSASLLFANGTSLDGARGSATVFSPGVGLDVGGRWQVSDMVQVVVGAGADLALIQQRFLVAGRVVADLRQARGRVVVGLSIPLR